ncbi:MAG: flagellar biosynthesis anti-sigma factor FlgM [Syntrophales bacterium]|nr:flagellar biosynthesis anti-sigma factor FlgM [Syntrophales bacterium]NLN59104.1 flagellar biosynthesis anti-sigma factor FlgM [Deltaproteobacteria bacterium]
MKISGINDATVQMMQQYQKNDGLKQEAERTVAGVASPREKVDLSTRAKDVQAIRNAVAGMPDIREEKVQELKDRIEAGTYNVSGEKIAEKIVGESLLDIFA